MDEGGEQSQCANIARTVRIPPLCGTGENKGFYQ